MEDEDVVVGPLLGAGVHDPGDVRLVRLVEVVLDVGNKRLELLRFGTGDETEVHSGVDGLGSELDVGADFERGSGDGAENGEGRGEERSEQHCGVGCAER